MKKIIVSALTVWLTICGSPAEATSKSENKIHVNEKNVYVKEGKLFIKTKKSTFSVKTIHSDASGLFILKKDIVRAKAKFYCPVRGCNYSTDDRDYLELHIWTKHRGFINR